MHEFKINFTKLGGGLLDLFYKNLDVWLFSLNPISTGEFFASLFNK